MTYLFSLSTPADIIHWSLLYEESDVGHNVYHLFEF